MLLNVGEWWFLKCIYCRCHCSIVYKNGIIFVTNYLYLSPLIGVNKVSFFLPFTWLMALSVITPSPSAWLILKIPYLTNNPWTQSNHSLLCICDILSASIPVFTLWLMNALGGCWYYEASTCPMEWFSCLLWVGSQ